MIFDIGNSKDLKCPRSEILAYFDYKNITDYF